MNLEKEAEDLFVAELRHVLASKIYNCRNSIERLRLELRRSDQHRSRASEFLDEIDYSIASLSQVLDAQRYKSVQGTSDFLRRPAGSVRLAECGHDVVRQNSVNYRLRTFKIRDQTSDSRALFLIDDKALVNCLWNIIDNAFSFSLQGRDVELTMENSSDEFQYTVTNICGGLDSSVPERWTDSGYSTKSVGHGFGLSVTQKICELLDMTMRINVENIGPSIHKVDVSLSLPRHHS